MIILAAGCGDPLKKPQLIEETRVIGARAEVEVEPGRAWPQPGEAATVRWLVAYPAAPVPLSWAFQICPAEDVAYGIPKCAAPAFAATHQSSPSLEEPRIDFVVPTEVASIMVCMLCR